MAEDIWDLYLRGAYELTRRLEQQHLGGSSLIEEARVLTARLHQGIIRMRLYGETPTISAELREVYAYLDQTARQGLGTSFNEVCNLRDDQLPPPPIPPKSGDMHIQAQNIGAAIQDNHGHIIINPPSKVKDGLEALQHGYQALQQKQFRAASQILEEAQRDIDTAKHPDDSAQAAFFLALSRLGPQHPGRLPNDAAYQAIEDPLVAAITLFPRRSSYHFARGALYISYGEEGMPRTMEKGRHEITIGQNLQIDDTDRLNRNLLNLTVLGNYCPRY